MVAARRNAPSTSRALFQSVAVLAAAVVLLAPAEASAQRRRARLSDDLRQLLDRGQDEQSTVILTASQAGIDALAARHGLRVRKRLTTGAVLEVPAGSLAAVAADPQVDQVSSNHAVRSQMTVTNEAVGADQIQAGGWAKDVPGLTGAGIGVAVIDSGVAVVPELAGRIVANVDFTVGDGRRGRARDEYGHGTHVAGIIAAAARGRNDATGVAPGAHILNLKVLDAQGAGFVADVVEAIDWSIENRRRFNIRVINLSLGGPVLQSWRDDPLCQAVERAFRAGIVVVAAAGNRGKLADGQQVFGGITAPGNSPFAITVGAINTKGTAYRSDDVLASFSSKGPTRFDWLVKPDLVAPGNRIVGLLAPNSTLAQEHPELVRGTGRRAQLELSGTSMAAAVVSGAAALISGANYRVSAFGTRYLLQYAASKSAEGGLLREGSGTLNILGSLSLLVGQPPTEIGGEGTLPSKLAFAHKDVIGEIDLKGTSVLWGARDNVLWGADDNVLWGAAADNVLWGARDNVLWGARDNVLWGAGANVLWGAAENVLWGASDNVLWGASENVLWGAGANVLWGAGSNVLWGADNNVLWGAAADNVLWGAGENVLWGASDNVLWGASDNVLWGASRLAEGD